MLILASAALLLFGIALLCLGALSCALLVALKLLEWTLRLLGWLLGKYAANTEPAMTEPEPQAAGGINIVINIVDGDEEPPMRDVTPKTKRIR